MTPHLHDRYVPGCYRCDLSRDEVREYRFVIHWNGSEWYVVDKRDDSVAATFATMLEAETYIIERSKRVER